MTFCTNDCSECGMQTTYGCVFHDMKDSLTDINKILYDWLELERHRG